MKISQHQSGRSVTDLVYELGLACSTTSTILKEKDQISETVSRSASLNSITMTKERAGPISEMEKILITWIRDRTQKCMPLSPTMIQAKARSLFEVLKD